jgi:hypothetical protein
MLEISTITAPADYKAGLKEIDKIQSSLQLHTMVGYWQIGSLISQMETNEGKYGKGIIPRVSADLQAKGKRMGDRILQEAHRFYKTYSTPKQVESLIRRHVEWSQVRAICKLPDNGSREELIHDIEEKGLTARDTEAAVRTILNKDKKPKVPAKKVTKDEEVIDVETTPVEAPPEIDKQEDAPAPTPAPAKTTAPPRDVPADNAIQFFQALNKSVAYLAVLEKSLSEYSKILPTHIALARDEKQTGDADYEDIADNISPSILSNIKGSAVALSSSIKAIESGISNVKWFE